MQTGKKSRTIRRLIGEQVQTSVFMGQPYGQTDRRTLAAATHEELLSNGHPWPPRRGMAGTDIGGPFSHVKSENFGATPSVKLSGAPGYYSVVPTMVGPMTAAEPYANPLLMPAATPLASSDMDRIGATAISQTIPTNPVAGAATFIGELKEGIPSIIGSQLLRNRVKTIRENAGSEYLNVEFGWKPLISDLRKFATAVQDSEKILAQYRRDSGRNVRRRWSLPSESTTEVEYDGPCSGTGYPYTPNNYAYFGNSGRVRVTKTFSRTVWFSGCYTYYLDPGDTALGRVNRHAQEANKLLGIRPTPDVLWELAPWSWAVDWQSNTGDVIRNYTAFAQDGLVLRYGYLMAKTVISRHVDVTGLVPVNGNAPSALSWTYRTTVKQRRPATPYGFGFDMTALTGRQSAILTALGMTKSGRR